MFLEDELLTAVLLFLAEGLLEARCDVLVVETPLLFRADVLFIDCWLPVARRLFCDRAVLLVASVLLVVMGAFRTELLRTVLSP